MSTLGIGIIGCGGITLQNHLPGLALCPDVRVAALCDSDPGTLQRASAATGCTVTTTNYHQLLAREDVHAIIIATPNLLHFPIAMAAIAAGKHILCEKPIAMTVEEARTMARAAIRAVSVLPNPMASASTAPRRASSQRTAAR